MKPGKPGKPGGRPSYVRVLGAVFGIVSRRAPLVLLAEQTVSLALTGTAVAVMFLLEQVLSQVTDPAAVSRLVGPILTAGAVIVLRELLEMLADPLSGYFGDKGASALTEALSSKAARLEVVEFETLAAHERLELAQRGVDAAITMLLFFMFSVANVAFFAVTAAYLYSLSPLLALVVPLVFAPRIVGYFVRGSRYYQLERKTVPLLREFQYLERCLADREYFKETRVLGAGARLLQRYRGVMGRFGVKRWREDRRLGAIDLGLSVLVLLGYGGAFLLAAWLLADGSIGVGGFAVVIYAVSQLLLMTEAVMNMFGASYDASARAAHLIEFLRLDEGRREGAAGAAGAGDAGGAGGAGDATAAGAVAAREVAFVIRAASARR